MSSAWFSKHQDILGRAVAASQSRRRWQPYAPTTSNADPDAGREAFEAYRNAQFYLDQPGVRRRAGAEVSPFGFELGVEYPVCAPEALVQAADSAMVGWSRADPRQRVGVCLEALARLADRGDELTQALMHTTGVPQSLARLQGVTHALGRGLEAVAVAWREMNVFSASADWEQRSQRHGKLEVRKRFSVMPRGVGLVIGCSAVPTWMALPGLFANLATGNATVVKPHPLAVLPLAIVVATLRATLKEAGFDANLVSLLVDEPAAPVTREVALHPRIKLIDYTGRRGFADWLQANAAQADLFLFTAATNCVVVDSTDDYKGMLRYLVGAMAYCSGQLPTSPQNILLPAAGIATPEGKVDAATFGRDLSFVLGKLVADPSRAAEVLGAIRNHEVVQGIELAQVRGDVLRESETIAHPGWPGIDLHPPLLLRCGVSEETSYGPEAPGPVNFLIEAASTASALALAERVMQKHGGLELLVYSTNPSVLQQAEEAAWRSGVHLSTNLTGTLSQVMNLISPCPFSDLQGSAGNPASTASLVDADFVNRRFGWFEAQFGKGL